MPRRSRELPTVPVCRRCGVSYVPIVYGFPPPELVEREERGEIVLGGCCMDESNPTHACPRCEATAVVTDSATD
jgi:hypothetical protein